MRYFFLYSKCQEFHIYRLAQVTLLLMSLAVFFSYALQFYVLMEVLGPNVIQPRVSRRWYSLTEYSVRVIINIFTCRDS